VGWMSLWRNRVASQAQALRLELAERDRLIGQLEADLRRQREGAKSLSGQQARRERERLVAVVATPLVQLATLTQLDSSDAAWMAVARSLLRGLADEGLELLGQVGSAEPYDPVRHEPLGDLVPGTGALVVVRAPGLAFGGVVLRRAGVASRQEGG
jgi:hypothetical protein